MWTVFSTKEYPPEPEEEKKEKEEPLVIRYKPSTYMLIGAGMIAVSVLLALWFGFSGLDKKLYVLCGVIGLFGASYLSGGMLMNQGVYRNGFVQIVRDFQNMPKTMIQLAFVQFFSWFALFSMWIYTTSAVTSHVYGTDDPSSALYNEGADWVGILFASYNGISALVALILPWVAGVSSRKFTHFLALSIGGLGLISIFFISNPTLLVLSMFAVGVAWASILSIPYAMLSNSLPAKKMGYYMGIFNFFIVIPQIIAASILGFFLTTFFNQETIYALVLGGLSMILAGVISLFVDDKDEVALKENHA